MVRYSKTSDSSYKSPFREAHVTDIARDLVLCRFVRDAVDSCYGRFVRVTKVVRRFSAALRLVEILHAGAASEILRATSGALGATQLGRAPLSRLDELDKLLYTKAAKAQTRGRKQNAACNGRAFYSHAVSLLRKLRSTLSAACEKHP